MPAVLRSSRLTSWKAKSFHPAVLYLDGDFWALLDCRSDMALNLAFASTKYVNPSRLRLYLFSVGSWYSGFIASSVASFITEHFGVIPEYPGLILFHSCLETPSDCADNLACAGTGDVMLSVDSDNGETFRHKECSGSRWGER